ncbi:MAG: hypothetical protein ACREC4_03065 [Methylocella sp.]
MAKEQVENIQDAARTAQSNNEGDEKRERSTIQFPYNDLDDAVTIAKAVHENAGISCTIDQLAAYVKNSLTSGAFRLRVSTASTFGLTDNARSEVRLTPLGRRIADPSQEAEAKVEAFLSVPLYVRIYDNYRGFTLPGAAALEKFMREVGVSSKQTGKARQAFMRSARQARFFDQGEDRLVRPASPGTKPIEEPKPEPGKNPDATRGGDGGPPHHPLIDGLFQSLPRQGENWTLEEAADWLQAAAYNFRIVYKLKGTITVAVATPTSMTSN